jgi:hypothetical protein
MLEVFRLECGGVRCLESVATLESAQARAQELAATSPAAEYLGVDLKTDERHVIKLGSVEESTNNRRAEAGNQ